MLTRPGLTTLEDIPHNWEAQRETKFHRVALRKCYGMTKEDIAASKYQFEVMYHIISLEVAMLFAVRNALPILRARVSLVNASISLATVSMHGLEICTHDPLRSLLRTDDQLLSAHLIFSQAIQSTFNTNKPSGNNFDLIWLSTGKAVSATDQGHLDSTMNWRTLKSPLSRSSEICCHSSTPKLL